MRVQQREYISQLLRLVAAVIICIGCGVSKTTAQETFGDSNYMRYHRGLVYMNNDFVSQGQWIVGGTASFTAHHNSNYNVTIIEGISSNGYSINASPLLAYAIKDNLAVGGRLEYGRTNLTIDNAQISLGDEGSEIEVGINDYYSITQSFGFKGIVRQYIPLGLGKRFALFNEIQLGYDWSTSKMAFDSPVTGVYATSHEVSLGLVPGVVAFATNSVAFEITIGVFSASYMHVDQVKNQIYEGSIDSSNMNFKINLLSIGLGVAFYL